MIIFIIDRKIIKGYTIMKLFTYYGEEYYDRNKINFYIELIGPSSILFI